MRCYCCNRPLNDFESTRKSETSGEYLDMCNKCMDGLDIPFTANPDFDPNQAPEDDFFWDDMEVDESYEEED